MPSRPDLRRRGVVLAAGLIFTALCAGCGEVHTQTALGPPRPVSVAIAGPPSGLYASLYAAQADGDFRLGALAVRITATPDPLSALASGRAAVAVASEPALLAARARGAQLVAIGALLGGPLDALVSPAGHAIASPAALAGGSIALFGGPLQAAELRAILAAAGVGPASVHVLATGVGTPLTAEGHVRAVLSDRWPALLAALALAHRPGVAIAVQHAGVPTYSGLVIAVRVGEAHRDGPLLRAFLQSLTRGQRAAAANPPALAATLAKLNPAMNAAFERALLRLSLPLAAPAGAARPFGYQDPGDWQTFGVWLRVHGVAGGSASAGLAVTDEFLPGQGEQALTP